MSEATVVEVDGVGIDMSTRSDVDVDRVEEVLVDAIGVVMDVDPVDVPVALLTLPTDVRSVLDTATGDIDTCSLRWAGPSSRMASGKVVDWRDIKRPSGQVVECTVPSVIPFLTNPVVSVSVFDMRPSQARRDYGCGTKTAGYQEECSPSAVRSC